MCDKELTIRHAFLGYALSGVVFDNVCSELVNGRTVLVVEVAWQNTIVRVFPLSVIVIVTDEPMKRCWEALKVLLSLLNSFTLGKSIVMVFNLLLVLGIQLKMLGVVVRFGVTRITIRAAIVFVGLGHLR